MGDLTHTTTSLSSDTMPINLGFIAEYCKANLNGNVEFKLFKYPGDLITALKSEHPDILTMSSYPWNRLLSLEVMKFYDSIHDDHINVLGGPNFPTNDIQFYKTHPQMNFYIPGEGEIPFLNIAQKVIDEGVSETKNTTNAISGSISLRNNELLSKDLFNNIADINDIPSPYTSGILDDFFDSKLNPFIQTNRGCPFKCAFCHTGSNPAFKKVRMFSQEHVFRELEYIAKKLKTMHMSKSLIVADSNFGMYPRDLEICSFISGLREKYGFPNFVTADYGKENRDNVLSCFREINKNTSKNPISVAVQSTSDVVADNIKRKRFDKADYMRFIDTVHEQDNSVLSEIIIPLPGETKDSHMSTLKTLINAKVMVMPYTLILLNGTELNSQESISKFGFEVKYRVVPRNYGTYDNIRSIEVEKVAVSTNTMTFDEYLELRSLHLLVKVFFHENSTFNTLIRLAEENGVSIEAWILKCYENIQNMPPELKSVFDDFKEAMAIELWDSEEELIEFFKQEINYKKLLSGELGGNLMQIYASKIFGKEYPTMLNFLVYILLKFSNKMNDAILDATNFLLFKNTNILDMTQLDKTYSCHFSYDIIKWLDQKTQPITDFQDGIQYIFYYTDEQKTRIRELINQYGFGDQEFGKILTRESLTTFHRTVKVI